MRHPDTIPEATLPAQPEKIETSRRSLLRGLGLASVGVAALAAGCSSASTDSHPIRMW